MFHDFNQEQSTAVMTANTACNLLGAKDALDSLIESARQSVDERLAPPVEGQDRINTPVLRESLQAFKDNVFPAILASIKGRNPKSKTVLSTALAMVALFDAFDRFDAICDDTYQVAEYNQEAA